MILKGHRFVDVANIQVYWFVDDVIVVVARIVVLHCFTWLPAFDDFNGGIRDLKLFCECANFLNNGVTARRNVWIEDLLDKVHR